MKDQNSEGDKAQLFAALMSCDCPTSQFVADICSKHGVTPGGELLEELNSIVPVRVPPALATAIMMAGVG